MLSYQRVGWMNHFFINNIWLLIKDIWFYNGYIYQHCLNIFNKTIFDIPICIENLSEKHRTCLRYLCPCWFDSGMWWKYIFPHGDASLSMVPYRHLLGELYRLWSLPRRLDQWRSWTAECWHVPGYVPITFIFDLAVWGCFNTLRPRRNGYQFPDDILKCIFLNEHV